MRNATWFGMFCVAGLSCALAACGDDTSTTTSTTAGTTTGQATTGSGGAGGAAPVLINGCNEDPAMAVDRTADAMVAIANVGSSSYDPKCVLVAVGTEVTFNVNFATHPLVGGEVVGGTTPTPDPESPIPATATGTTVDVTLATPGVYPYYCGVHAPAMAGVIFVE